jgi:5-methylcytosine-specific restriction endonuclease McrA
MLDPTDHNGRWIPAREGGRNQSAFEVKRARYLEQIKYAERWLAGEGFYTDEEWRAKLLTFAAGCPRCGHAWGEKRHAPRVDHIIPIREGGTHWGSNIQPLCVNCNANKGAFHIRYVMTDRGVVGLAAA